MGNKMYGFAHTSLF